MKIALIGHGKMGKMVEQQAHLAGHEIVAIITPSCWDESAIAKADVCIEFTRPDAVISNIVKLARLNKPIVVGTTGWESDFQAISDLVDQSKVGLVYSPNFSIGMNLYFHLVDQFSRQLAPFAEFAMAGIEYHHQQKLDSPSGTAKAISSIIKTNHPSQQDFSFHSVRCGTIVGTHTVMANSPAETLTLTHCAHNREGFAKGALVAADWIQHQSGLYSFSDCLQSIIGQKKC